MLLSFFENIEIHNIVNLVIACFVLSYVIRKKFSKDSELGFYDKIMLVLIIIVKVKDDE